MSGFHCCSGGPLLFRAPPLFAAPFSGENQDALRPDRMDQQHIRSTHVADEVDSARVDVKLVRRWLDPARPRVAARRFRWATTKIRLAVRSTMLE